MKNETNTRNLQRESQTTQQFFAQFTESRFCIKKTLQTPIVGLVACVHGPHAYPYIANIVLFDKNLFSAKFPKHYLTDLLTVKHLFPKHSQPEV